MSPRFDSKDALVSVSDLKSESQLRIGRECSLVFTLEIDPEGAVSRGHVRAIGQGTKYPIQSNLALFEALSEYLNLKP